MTDVVPPTTFLPPLKLLKTCSGKEIWDALASLRYIYLPEVRGSSRRRRGVGSHSHPAVSHQRLEPYQLNPEKKSNDLSAIRADGFERSFAIQWLTRFVSLFSEVGDESSGSSRVSSMALEEAASLLAICAGAAASGSVTRTFTFPLPDRAPNPTVVPRSYSSSTPTHNSFISVDSPNTVEEGMDKFTVILRDAPLESSDFSSVGAQTWGGSCILAEMIAENPTNFSIFSREQLGTLQPRVNAPFRALELGAGTGLASLVLGKVLERIRSMDRQCTEPISFDTRRVPLVVDTVFATDFHPSVLANLQFNVALNFPAASINSHSPVDNESNIGTPHTSCCAPNMVVLPLDWSMIHSLAHPISNPVGKETSESSAQDNKWPNDADALFRSRPQTSHPVLDQTDLIRDRQQVLANNANILTSATPSSTSSIAPQLDIPFDVIIGADIIYEHSHALWVRACVERFLRKPTRPSSQTDEYTIQAPATAPGHSYQSDTSPLGTDQRPIPALFHLIIPLRRTHAVESRSVEEVFRLAADM
ncbi:hypothetical protein JB92DRAFT_3042784 [Gautieria morchelliformis]|nr:hypothetical protein JB92DRAFT_3042784 [Gautieria morchelliformis]